MPKTFIIAEVGSNHQGSFNLAKSYVEQAKITGADAVKFQLIPPFKPEWIDPLIEECKRVGIEFMATPFNQAGIDALKGKVKHWKIASTEAADEQFVQKVLDAAGDDPVFISDGAVKEVPKKKNVVPLQCVVKYPADVLDYTLGLYSGEWGLSDHTPVGSWLPLLAVARGASVIEKTFTLNKKWKGPDHPYALEPDEFTLMVQNIRAIEQLITNKKTTITTYVGRKLQWP